MKEYKMSDTGTLLYRLNSNSKWISAACSFNVDLCCTINCPLFEEYPSYVVYHEGKHSYAAIFCHQESIPQVVILSCGNKKIVLKED